MHYSIGPELSPKAPEHIVSLDQLLDTIEPGDVIVALADNYWNNYTKCSGCGVSPSTTTSVRVCRIPAEKVERGLDQITDAQACICNNCLRFAAPGITYEILSLWAERTEEEAEDCDGYTDNDWGSWMDCYMELTVDQFPRYKPCLPTTTE